MRFFRYRYNNYLKLQILTCVKCNERLRLWKILTTIQSQKTQGFCVADFATLSDERRSSSKIFRLFIWIKEPCVRKFEGLERSKLLGISQTELFIIWLMLNTWSFFLLESNKEEANFHNFTSFSLVFPVNITRERVSPEETICYPGMIKLTWSYN